MSRSRITDRADPRAGTLTSSPSAPIASSSRGSASSAWLQAQSQYPQTGSSQKGASASGQTTVEGCLQGSDGNYTLTDKSGTTHQLQGDTSKLSAHVGHEVQITGSTTSASSATSPTTGTPAGATQQPTLTVQNMKHISKTCKSASPK